MRTCDGVEHYNFMVRSVALREQLDQPYTLDLRLRVADTDLDLSTLVHSECEVVLGREDKRCVHGVVTHCQYEGTFADQLNFRLVVEPAVALLRYSQQRRIFQDLSVPEIAAVMVAEVFAMHGRDLALRLAKGYEPRDYCVQYDETDLAFLGRILAEEGISFVFDQATDGPETMVLLDGNAALAPLGASVLEGSDHGPTYLPVIPTSNAELADVESVQYFTAGHQLRTSSHSVQAWDMLSAQPQVLSASRSARGQDEGHGHRTIGATVEHARRRLTERDGAHVDPLGDWVALAQNQARVRGEVARGICNAVHMTAGSTCEIVDHINPDLDGKWVVTSVALAGEVPAVELADSCASTFEIEFDAQRLALTAVPAAVPVPRVQGPHTAIVVGPAGEDIHTDALGRVRVRMLWDSRPVSDESTCWLRVAQAWAGQGFGTMFLPRIGMEVVVSFLDGDPNRPIVTGCVYNAQNTPPLDLPAKRSCSTIRTETTPGGKGFNELRFEDAKGQQEVFLHAQRTLREVVGDLHLSNVGGERKEFIGKDKHTQVANDFGSLVGGSYDLEVSGSHAVYVGCALPQDPEVDSPPGPGRATLNVDGEREVWCEQRHFLEVGKAARSSMEAKPGELELAADQKLVLRVGKSVFTMTEDHIVLSSPSIEFKSAASCQRMDGAVELVSEGNIGAYAGASGPKSGSAQLELRTDGTLLRAADALFVESGGEAVVSAEGLASVSGESVRLSGRSSALLEADNVSVKAGTQAGIDGGAALKLTAKVRIDIN